MEKMRILFLVCLMAVAAQAAIIDDFQDGDVSDYTNTVILDVNGGGSNTAAWQASGGVLQLNTTAFDGIEQYAFIKSGYTLNVGEELQVEIDHNGASQDLGLYVGLAPEFNNRHDYISVYARNSSEVLSRGFNGTSEMNLKGGTISESAYDTLFILRDADNDYEAGYYNGSTRVVIADRNGLVFGAGDTLVIGLYSDVRAVGVLGNADNLAIIPEPATLAMLGLGGVLALRRRRK